MRIFAADIGGTSIKAGIGNSIGEISNYIEIPTDSHRGGPTIINSLLDKIAEHKNLDAIAISTAGQVDSENGRIVYANGNLPNYTGMPIKEIIEDRFSVPVYVENDVNCAALGEKYYGFKEPINDFLCLTYGTGIGGAIIENDRIIKGSNGVAGEFGHMITHHGGLLCTCGGYGCYEQYASTTALIKRVQSIDSSIKNGRDLFEKLNVGNQNLDMIVQDWINEIVTGLVTLTHIFNPKVIVIGGGVMERKFIVEQIRTKFFEHVIHSFDKVKIQKAKLGNKAGLLGAISLALV